LRSEPLFPSNAFYITSVLTQEQPDILSIYCILRNMRIVCVALNGLIKFGATLYLKASVSLL